MINDELFNPYKTELIYTPQKSCLPFAFFGQFGTFKI